MLSFPQRGGAVVAVNPESLRSTKKLSVARMWPRLLVFICLLEVLAGAADVVGQCAAVRFKGAARVAAGVAPAALVARDFNGDAHPDLAVANNGSNNVSVLLGNGAGTFAPPTNYTVGSRPHSISAGDFNGDGKADLVTANYDSANVSVLLGTGAGTFGGASNYATFQDPQGLVAGDFNGDGLSDIALGSVRRIPGGSNSVVILLSNGAGGFNAAALFNAGGAIYDIITGKFNGDNALDLALRMENQTAVFTGNGSGGFNAASPLPVGFGVRATGDFNGDGKPDLVGAHDYNDGIWVALGDGAGNFSAPSVFPGRAYQGIVVGDFNGDGKSDIAALDGNASVSILHGDGTGQLGPETLYGLDTGESSIASADFNADGKPDLAIANRSNNAIAMLYATTGGEFAGVFNIRSGSRPHDLVRADFNRDGNDDLAVINAESAVLEGFGASSVSVFLGDGAGRMSAAPAIQFQDGMSLTSIVTADFNNDGKPDLAVSMNDNSTTDRVSVMLGNGDGAFAAPTHVALGAYGSIAINLEIADINRDGLTDIVVAFMNSGNFATLLSTGNGAFTIAAGSKVTGSSFYEDFSIADFNQDGNPDLVYVRNYEKFLTVLFGNGTGYFNTRVDHPLPNDIQRSVIAQDFNRDGKADVAFISNNGSITGDLVTIRLGDGAGNFGDAAEYEVGNYSPDMSAADFNGDSVIDLVVTGAIYGDVNILIGDGAGGFSLSPPLRLGGYPGSTVGGDFNRDGKTDLAVSLTGADSVALFLNDSIAPLPCLSIDDVAVTEGDTGQSNAAFKVVLSEASTQTVRVNFRVAPRPIFIPQEMKFHAPSAGADYFSPTGVLTFLPGTTTQTINVPVYGDTSDEYDEAFAVFLSTPANAAIQEGVGIGTILDNDAPPTVFLSDVSITEGNTAATPKTFGFHVSLSSASAKTIAVPYQTAPGTATAASDYQHAAGSLKISPGFAGQTINIGIIGDAVYEPDETFFLNFDASPNVTLIDPQAQITILNDDPQHTLSVLPANVDEGDAGTSEAAVQVVLSAASTQPVTVNYATTNGTATAGSDYVAASGSLTFNPGELSQTVKVPVNGDTLDEIDETFGLTLSGATNASIGTAQSVVTIRDNDGPTISLDDISVLEGDFGFREATFTVTLSAASPQFVSVGYETGLSGSATSGDDYRPLSPASRISIPPGERSAKFHVQIIGDVGLEPDETFAVNLHLPVGGTIADGSGVGTILNDDTPGTLQFSAPSYSVNENSGFATFNVNRVGGSSGTVSVVFAAESGTATAGADFQGVSYAVTFLHGETTKTGLLVPVTDDALDEEAETVNLSLKSPTNGALLGSPATAVLTIQDDDSTCVESISPASRTSPAEGETTTVNVTAQSGCAWTAVSTSNFISVTSGASGAGNGVVTLNVLSNGSGVPRTGSVIIGGQTLTITQPETTPAVPTLQFGAASYTTGEGVGLLTVPVTRTGGSLNNATVDYRTLDTDAFTVSCADTTNNNAGAFARCDFATSVGRLGFAPGETQKTISIPIINDGHDEAAETFQIVLSNPTGVALLGAPATTTVTIQDDDPADAPNPVFTTPFFVRQHYLDFLSREPEAGEPWSAILNNCANPSNLDPASPSATCDRLIVSQSFFGSPEFQLKGFYVFRLYKLAFDRLPEYSEIVSDMSFVAGATQAEVYARKAQLASAFAARQEFANAYGGLSNAGFVETLLGRYGLTRINTPDPQQPDGTIKMILTQGDLITRLNADALTRGQVLRAVADSDEAGTREFDNAFVAMQYYGYLRRKPEAAGYEAWLAVLRRGDIRTMVNGFMNSAEYKLRFGRQ
ncbi:MAG TPA: Calx-beta domain-containing protein [Pyrinomonadaceae bacterium]|jgi:hypothetical protein